MYTSVVLIALSGVVVPAESEEPSWMTSYSEAREKGKAASKPLAVFLAPGKEGWQKLGRDAGLDEKSRKVLASRYICVFLDTATDSGKQWAKDFEMTDGIGLVISDGSGKYQAFRHEGTLTTADLARNLDRYSAPDREMRSTETLNSSRTTYYSGPPGGTIAPQVAYPAPAYGRSYCPT